MTKTPIDHCIYLQYDFSNDNNEPLAFSNPEKIIVTHRIEEIETCLLQVEQALKSGKYAAGFLSYEATYALRNIKPQQSYFEFPLIWFGIFTKPETIKTLDSKQYSIGQWNMTESQSEYNRAFNSIKTQISHDKLKQINYTVRWNAEFTGDSYTYYNAIKEAQPTKYNAYLHIGQHSILSASPELFFERYGENIFVRPMKGTVHRGKTYEEDQENKQWLAKSEKNKTENRLTTLLMKKELEQLALPNSVHIINPYQIEQYSTVYQMTSTIKAKIHPKTNLWNIFKQLFPCTSIAGTPKDEAIKTIQHIENNQRNIYCGAIGFIKPNQDAIFNVPIRTISIDHSKQTATYGTGGAITKQSQLHEEYNEMLSKTHFLHKKNKPFELLETIGLHDGHLYLLNNHLKRIKQSATYFNYKINIHDIKRALLNKAKEYDKGLWRIRLLLNKTGSYTINITKQTSIMNNKICLAQSPIDKENIFFYHKTTKRDIYNIHRQSIEENVFDVLLWNKNEEITEFTIGNIVIRLNGRLITPPISSGLLPGTFRKKLLKENIIEEDIIYKQDIITADKIWLINSVRKWVEVFLI